jgi:heme-degrading monooxygenase HmoA
MFARILEMKTKPGKEQPLCTAIRERGLPILRKFPGFLDVLCLASNTVRDPVLAMTFWTTKRDADRYQAESYRTVANLYAPFLEGEIRVRTFEVKIATVHRVLRKVA